MPPVLRRLHHTTRHKQATPPPPLHWLAAALVAVSTYMHSVYGPAVPKTTADGDAGVTPSSSKKRQ